MARSSNRQLIRLREIRSPDAIDDQKTGSQVRAAAPAVADFEQFNNLMLSVLRNIQGSAAWDGAGGVALSRSFVAACTATEQVGDCVCYVPSMAPQSLSSNMPCVARADITDISRMPVVGIVLDKSSFATCTVLTEGSVALFTGLKAGQMYFVGPQGQPQIYPFANMVTPFYLQRVGVAATDRALVFGPAEITSRVVP